MSQAGPHADASARPSAGDGTDDAGPESTTWRDVVAAYVGLTKPRVIELLLLTTVPVMFFAERGIPALALVVRDRHRRRALGRLRVGVQLRLRPRHRRADASYASPGAAAAHRLAASRPWSSPRCWPCSRPWCSALWVNWLSAGAVGAGQRVLRLRLHDAAQAPHHPEHRLGRPRRLLPGADRLDGRHRRAGVDPGRAVPRRLLLDAAAHLGAGPALPRGLPQRRRPDAARWSSPPPRSVARSSSTAG